MKKIILILMFIPIVGMSQQSEKMVVDSKDLPPALVEQLKAKQQIEKTNQTIEQYSTWAGKGKEVGEAIRGGLMAVKDVSVEFSQTNLGKFTMVLVAWKVVGKDIFRLILGVILWVTFTAIIVRTHNKMCLRQKIIVKNPGLFKYPKEYEVKEPILNRDGSWSFAVIWLIANGITAMIMFI